MHAGSHAFTSKDSKVWLLSDNASCEDSGPKIISHAVIFGAFLAICINLQGDFDLTLEALPFHVPKYFFGKLLQWWHDICPTMHGFL